MHKKSVKKCADSVLAWILRHYFVWLTNDLLLFQRQVAGFSFCEAISSFNWSESFDQPNSSSRRAGAHKGQACQPERCGPATFLGSVNQVANKIANGHLSYILLYSSPVQPLSTAPNLFVLTLSSTLYSVPSPPLFNSTWKPRFTIRVVFISLNSSAYYARYLLSLNRLIFRQLHTCQLILLHFLSVITVLGRHNLRSLKQMVLIPAPQYQQPEHASIAV